MSRLWDSIFGLNDFRSIVVEQEDLGLEQFIEHRNKRYFIRIPPKINEKVVLRLKGLGKKRFNKTGDLLLRIWLNRGEDIRQNLWLSETAARNGAEKILKTDEKKIFVKIPSNSYHGLTLCLKGLGREPSFPKNVTFLNRKSRSRLRDFMEFAVPGPRDDFQKIRGNMLVRLCVYPDNIKPNYGSFDTLATDDMVAEGWIYKKIEEINNKISRSSFPDRPMQACQAADAFNEFGWIGIFNALINHLNLEHLALKITISDSIPVPGSCQATVTYSNTSPPQYNYLVTINTQFIDNPFTIAAIMAHELCHIVYSERINNPSKIDLGDKNDEQRNLELERTVDLLTFMFKVSEFQLRAARDTRITFGYFRQELFERMQVIVARKLNTHG